MAAFDADWKPQGGRSVGIVLVGAPVALGLATLISLLTVGRTRLLLAVLRGAAPTARRVVPRLGGRRGCRPSRSPPMPPGATSSASPSRNASSQSRSARSPGAPH
ncbi:hypothetical protein, partial [Streptomyces sp. NPDC002346]